jgi:alginate O-acetyltransferase complex protein AlgJ
MKKVARAQAAADTILIVAFLAGIALPLAGDVFGLKLGPELVERRELARAPVWGKDPVMSLPKKIESFYDDHFAFRNVLILAHNMLRHGLMRVSSEKVLIGRDGWLYYRPDTIEDYLGLTPLTAAGVDSWQKALEGRSAWLAERGVPYLFFVAPNQCTLYPEHLPEHIGAHPGKTRYDELYALARSPTLPLLDARGALAAARAEGPVYPAQGTHWTGWGSYVVYREVCGWLSERRADLLARPLGEFTLGKSAKEYELFELLGLPRPGVSYTPSIQPAAGWRAHAAAVTTPAALSDLEPGRIWALENEDARGCLLVMGDSFLYQDVGFSRLLAEHFRRSVFVVNASTYESLSQLVAQEHPDFVVEELVERNLGIVPARHAELAAARRRAGLGRTAAAPAR